MHTGRNVRSNFYILIREGIIFLLVSVYVLGLKRTLLYLLILYDKIFIRIQMQMEKFH